MIILDPRPALSLLALLVTPGLLHAQFTPPVMHADAPDKAKARAVQSPESVVVTDDEALGMPVVMSTSPERAEQDAINAAVAKIGDEGVCAIGTGSGIGFVSTYTAEYSKSPNPNLTKISQRSAAVRAHLKAKAQLMESMNEVSVEGAQKIAQASELINTDSDALYNSELNQEERARTYASGLVRGAVIYDFVDDPVKGAVRVSVVTTPKTRGQVAAGTSARTMHATDFENAMALIRAQIEAGVVPPDGGKTICLPDGSVAFVGFGSFLIPQRKDGSVPSSARGMAKTAAKANAQKSLLAVIKGEEIKAETENWEEFKQSEVDYELQLKEDGSEEFVQLAETEKRMFSATVTNQTREAAVSGTLPAGCYPITCAAPDGWAVVAMVWHAPVAAELSKVGEEMANPAFKGTNQGTRGDFQINSDGSFKRDEAGKLIPVSLGKGRVTQDKDL
jgi:hypothetical protein